MSEWIPVSERLPEEGVPVLVSDIKFPESICTALIGWEEDGWHWETMSWASALNEPSAYEWDDDYQFTHWMPLPEPPEEQGDGER